MIWTTLFVALGGAIGAALRYLTNVGATRLFGFGFPYGTLAVNIIGSAAMGVLGVVLAHKGGTRFAPFLITGVLGGFTTFSAFSLDTVTLMERGAYGTAMLYVGLSVAGAVGALMLGMVVTRGILA
jgi:CrcB protein